MGSIIAKSSQIHITNKIKKRSWGPPMPVDDWDAVPCEYCYRIMVLLDKFYEQAQDIILESKLQET